MGKRRRVRDVPAYAKHGAVEAPTLFPELHDDVVTGDAPGERAAAFISRWSKCGDIYEDTIVKYQASTGDIQVHLEKIKSLYVYYLHTIDEPWDVEKFFCVCVWCMDTGRPLTRGTFLYASRAYDSGRLPLDKVDGFNANDYEYIIGERKIR